MVVIDRYLNSDKTARHATPHICSCAYYYYYYYHDY